MTDYLVKASASNPLCPPAFTRWPTNLHTPLRGEFRMNNHWSPSSGWPSSCRRSLCAWATAIGSPGASSSKNAFYCYCCWRCWWICCGWATVMLQYTDRSLFALMGGFLCSSQNGVWKQPIYNQRFKLMWRREDLSVRCLQPPWCSHTGRVSLPVESVCIYRPFSSGCPQTVLQQKH